MQPSNLRTHVKYPFRSCCDGALRLSFAYCVLMPPDLRHALMPPDSYDLPIRSREHEASGVVSDDDVFGMDVLVMMEAEQ